MHAYMEAYVHACLHGNPCTCMPTWKPMYMYAYMEASCTCMPTWKPYVSTCMPTCMQAYVRTCKPYVCMQAYVRTCKPYVRTCKPYIRTCKPMYVHASLCTYMQVLCTYMHAYVHACNHAATRTYTWYLLSSSCSICSSWCWSLSLRSWPLSWASFTGTQSWVNSNL